MTYRLHCWKWAASCPNRNEIRRRGRRALQVESLEARLLLYAVNDPGDAGLDPSVGPAETSNGTITFRSALDQIQLDGGGEIDLGGLTVNFSDESDPYLINGPAPLTLDGGGGTINGSVPSGGGAVSNVTITGGLSIQGDGSVTMAMVNGLTISGQGTLTNVTITGGGAEISGDGNVTSATVNGGLDIAGAGTVFDSTINGGLDIGGAAAVSTVTVSVQGGVGGLALSGGGTVTNATIAGDSDISDGGSISGSMFNGAVSFDAGGSLAGSTLATGPLYFSDGGSVTNSTITDGGVGASGGAVIQDDILTGAGAISLSGADNQVVGSNVSGGIMLTRGSTGDLIQGNTIWGNQAYLGDGIFLDSSGDSDSPLSSGNMIVDNMIGTDASGNAVAAAPNAGDGINIEGAWDTLIKGNVISGNTGYGISIINYSEEPSTGTMIVGNKIGTNGAGNAALPNGKGGVVASFSSSGSVAAVPEASVPIRLPWTTSFPPSFR